MAKFNVVGFEDVERELLMRSKKAETAVPKMLKAGAEVLVKGQKQVSREMGVYDTGDFHDSIKATKIKEKDGAQSVDVYPQGTDRKGVRNAEKGFIAEYGTSRIEARPWMSTANARYAKEVHDAMRAAWEESATDG